MIVDIFIKTYRGDFAFLKYCLASIDKYARGFRRVVIVSDYGDTVITKMKHKYKIINEKIPESTIEFQNGIGYRWQMAIKMNWVNYTDADAVLIIDSDCIFTAPVTPDVFFTNGKPNWIKRPWTDAENGIIWRQCQTQFFNKKCDSDYMCFQGFILLRQPTIDINEYCIKNHGCTMTEYIMSNRCKKFSEFVVFGTFLDLNNYDYSFIQFRDFKKYPIMQYWSWGGLTKKVMKSINELL